MYTCVHKYKSLGIASVGEFLLFPTSDQLVLFFKRDFRATVSSLHYTQFLSSIIFYVLSLFSFILHSGLFLECSPRSTNNRRGQIKTVRTVVICHSAGKIMIPQLLKCGNFPEPASFQGLGTLPH